MKYERQRHFSLFIAFETESSHMANTSHRLVASFFHFLKSNCGPFLKTHTRYGTKVTSDIWATFTVSERSLSKAFPYARIFALKTQTWVVACFQNHPKNMSD